jgi:uncharacterized protein (TIGR04255 family)
MNGMANPKYPGAPIVEAIVEIQIQSPVSLTRLELYDRLQCFRGSLTQVEINNTQVVVNLDPNQNAIETKQVHETGVRFTDGTVAIDVMPTSMIYRVLAYPGWEKYIVTAMDYWSKYSEVTNPTSVSNLSLRYTNRFLFPLDFVKLYGTKLFNPSIDAPTEGTTDEKNKNLRNYILQMEIENPDIQSIARIHRGTAPLQPNESAEMVPIILDIHVHKMGNFSTEKILNHLEMMHDWEIKIFEDTISNEVREKISQEKLANL